MTEVIVIGGGIAGASVGYYLAASGMRVLLVEAEAQLAYHTTGRSAALFFENYGVGPIRPLTKASRQFLEHPPAGLADFELLAPRGALTIAHHTQIERLQRVAEEGERMGANVRLLDSAAALDLVPALRRDWLAGVLWEPDAADMDVAALHQAFVRGMRRHGAESRTSFRVENLEPTSGGWEVRSGSQVLSAEVVVNAAGAWGDELARLAGLQPVGLTPLRRTAFMVPGDPAQSSWPLVVDVDHQFYFKPDGTQLLCSPADETPSEPCDARPEDVDIALAIERINQATTLAIRSVRSAWAGLRTFAPDRAMVIGFEPGASGFFWLVGQGGTGIQTAPAAGRLAASLIVGDGVPEDVVAHGLDLSTLLPDRFRGTGAAD